jgi:hypothetical protein
VPTVPNVQPLSRRALMLTTGLLMANYIAKPVESLSIGNFSQQWMKKSNRELKTYFSANFTHHKDYLSHVPAWDFYLIKVYTFTEIDFYLKYLSTIKITITKQEYFKEI